MGAPHAGAGSWRRCSVGQYKYSVRPMRGSCCGYGKNFGYVALQDGRMLVITDTKLYYQELRWICVALKYFLRRQIKYVINRWRWWFDFS